MGGKGRKPLAGIRSQQVTGRDERAVAEEGSFEAVHLRCWKEECETLNSYPPQGCWGLREIHTGLGAPRGPGKR